MPSDELGDRRPPDLSDSDAFHVIVEFGHEFDGYEKFGGFERLAEMAQGLERQFRETGRWEGTIDELRGTLFFMLRRDRHTDLVPTVTLPDGTEYTPGGEEDSEDLDMLRLLYNSIRDRWDEVSFG